MPHFIVLPTDDTFTSAEIVAPDAARVLTIIQNLDCKEADVSRDGVYSFSVRLGANGVWILFHRDEPCETDSIQSFG